MQIARIFWGGARGMPRANTNVRCRPSAGNRPSADAGQAFQQGCAPQLEFVYDEVPAQPTAAVEDIMVAARHHGLMAL